MSVPLSCLPSSPHHYGATQATQGRQATQGLAETSLSWPAASGHSRENSADMTQVASARAGLLRRLLAVGFGVVVVVLLLALVLTLHTPQELPGPQRTPSYPATPPEDAVTFEEFVNREFGAREFNGSWWSDSELQWKDQEGNLVTWDLNTNETKVLVSYDLLTSISGSGASFKGFSPDKSLLLFSVERESIWRHSYTARYLVFSPSTNSTTSVGMEGEEEARLQYCDWVENKEDLNTLVIVYGNNLYWRPNVTEGHIKDIALSSDGLADTVFNGIPDWVYEEEVLGVNFAHYINSPATRIAFAKFNDSEVEDFRYPHYGDPEDVTAWQYPEYRTVRYPKAGQDNPTVSLHVRNLEEAESKAVVAPVEVEPWGEFIYTVAGWTDDDVLSVTWMNRIQNSSVLSECREDGAAWTCVTILARDQPGGWIEIAPPPLYTSDGAFLVIRPSEQADGLSYPHVALVPRGGGDVTFLTQGQFVVTELLDWREDGATVYFMGTDRDAPGARHLYTVSTTGSSPLQCVTCSLPTSRGEVCQRSRVLLSPSLDHYVHTCLGQGLPEAVLRRADDHTIIFEFETNSELEEKLAGKALPQRVDTWVELDGGFRAPVKLLLPPHMDENAKYPVLVYVYGGPGSQMVTDSWGVGWGEYLVTSREVVYASIDGRGTGFQSNEHLFQVYRKLGTVEMVDQREVTRKLLEQSSYLDPNRAAIWGWSYGGFATAMTLEQDQGPHPVFSCGISVAPVTSWLLYDSIYTERYMATPEENPGGYNNSVITGMEGLRNKTWMLNHGVADDNVHFQHSMLLTKALERADIQFTQHSYPDENHSLGGVSRFLYHAMDNFWAKCFKEQ